MVQIYLEEKNKKIAALRAFNSNASVMILDEITSSIDNENAIEIYKTLLENSSNRITLIIAHNDLPEAFATRTIKIGDKSYQDSEPLMW